MNIVWSPQAKNDYWKNIEYLENNWSLKEAANFIDRVDKDLKRIVSETVVYKKTNYKSTFSVLIVKQITLYYRINNNNIELLRFWNNYQDLNKLKLE